VESTRNLVYLQISGTDNALPVAVGGLPQLRLHCATNRGCVIRLPRHRKHTHHTIFQNNTHTQLRNIETSQSSKQ
jgi:hypothetical protein